MANAKRAKFDYWYSDNHWSNEETTQRYVQQVLVPNLNRKREELGLPMDFPSIWIIDCWSVHIKNEFLAWMREKYPSIRLLFVPANCTGKMQPCDLAGQRELKGGLRAYGSRYCAVSVREAYKVLEGLEEEERQQRIKDGALKPDTSLTTLKRYVPDWQVASWERLQATNTYARGWRLSKLVEVWGETGQELYELALRLHETGELWAGTRAGDGDEKIPAGLKKVHKVVRGVGEVEFDVPERLQSETDIAEAAAALERGAASAAEVRKLACMHVHDSLC